MVIDIPGVVDWGGVVLALVHALGIHLKLMSAARRGGFQRPDPVS
jgi:hypothetical protein